MSENNLFDALAYVRRTPGIREILLSGGDPLMLPAERLLRIISDFMAVPHVEVVRIGTRFPVVLPQRFTQEFCRELGACGPVWIATHFNHPHELTEVAAAACENLVRAGVPVVNQTVLLRGVNDRVDVLCDLFTGLLRMRVKPYYLFHGDPVAGAMHFRTGIDRGLELMRDVSERISGLALPVFAFDLPRGQGKIRLEPDRSVGCTEDGMPVYRGRHGEGVAYGECGAGIARSGD